MSEALLGTISLKLKQDGLIAVELDYVEPDTLVEILDSAREPYENSHTLATVLRVLLEHYETLNENIKSHI